MAKHDLAHNIKVVQNIEPQKITATTSGSAQDTAGYASVVAEVNVGTITDGTHTFTLQESDTTVSGDFTDVAAADLLGSFTAATSAADQAVQWVGYRGSKRYVRVKNTVSGTTTTGGVIGASILLGHPENAPTF